MKRDQNLVAWLVFHAQRERDLVRLAMAFKLQKPTWGSHATIVAAGLASYLQFIDWDLAKAEGRFGDWHAIAAQTHDRSLLMLRSSQIKELADLVLRPRLVATRDEAADDASTPASLLLPRLINRGLVYGDVQVLAREGVRSPLSERMLPDLRTDDGLRDLYASRHAELQFVSADDYVGAARDGARGEHPDVLLRHVLEHWSILTRLGAFDPPLVANQVVRIPVNTKDRSSPEFPGKALDA